MMLLLSNRRYLYALVSRVFSREPDDCLFLEIANAHAEEECTLLDDDSQEGACIWGRVLESVKEVDLLRLNREYTKLFIGPGSLPAPPWESVYVTGEPLLFQESTLAVRDAYRRSGFVSAGYPREADDHVAIELDFMATLASKTCDTVAGDRGVLEAQLAFLEEHLLAWVDSFAERLGACGTVSGFYPSFARLAALVCRRDAEVLRELLAA